MPTILSLEKPRNSAARIANVLIRAAKQSGGNSCLAVWRYALELDANEDEHRIAGLLAKLRKEVQATDKALTQENVPAHLFKPAVTALLPMLAIGNLSQPWSNLSAGAAADHVMAMRWAAHTLPEDVQQVDAADLEELRRLLAEFDAAMEDAVLPPVLHSLLLDQLAAMKDAIAAVSVSGVADIKAAVRKAVSDVHFNQDEIKKEAAAINQEAAEDVRSKFGRLYRKGAEIAGDTEKYVKMVKQVYDGGVYLIGKASDVIEKFGPTA